MAITKEKKTELMSKYAEHLEKSSAIFLTGYKGVTVNEMTGLRKELKTANSGYSIVKNTLILRVMKEAGLSGIGLEELFEGPVAISFCYGEPPPTAKMLVEFAKGNDLFEIKGGLLGDVFLSADAINNLADLPPMDVVRAQLLGVISGPASQLAGVIAGGVRQIVNVLDAYAKSEDSDDA